MDGNELEKQVKDILQKDGWQVSTGAYYKDSSTKNPAKKILLRPFLSLIMKKFLVIT